MCIRDRAYIAPPDTVSKESWAVILSLDWVGDAPLTAEELPQLLSLIHIYSYMDVQEMTRKRKKLLSLMAAMDNYSDYLLLWSPRDKKLWYLDIEHEEFHPLAKWDDFIADPGRYLNGMIEGEFEE